jgi:hypothetical protein
MILPPAGCALRTTPSRRPLRQGPPDEEKPIVPSTLQSAPESVPGVFPRNHSDGFRVDLLETTMNLVSPGLLCVPVDIDIVSIHIQAFQQRVDQRGAGFGWKREGILKEIGRLGSHGLMVCHIEESFVGRPPTNWYRVRRLPETRVFAYFPKRQIECGPAILLHVGTGFPELLHLGSEQDSPALPELEAGIRSAQDHRGNRAGAPGWVGAGES